MRAYDEAENRSGFSNQKSVTTLDTLPPSAPGALAFTQITPTSAKASWSAASDNVGVTGYRYRLNSGAWTNIGNVLTFNLTDLAAATSHTLRVRARDAAGNWGATRTGTFTTDHYADSMSMNGALQVVDNGNGLQTGYIQGGSFGSLTPSTTVNGKTIESFWSNIGIFSGTVQTYLTVSGFSGNPGASWLQSISVSGGGTGTGASASFSCSSSTRCTWYWTSTAINAPSGSSTVTIVHK